MEDLNVKEIFEYEEKFRTFLTEERKMKESTVSSYISDLKKFHDFCEKKAMLEEHDLKKTCDCYLETLKNSGKSSATISRNIASLRKFSHYLKDNGIIDKNPTKGVAYEKNLDGKDEDFCVLTLDEIDRLIEKTKSDSIKGYRDTAILEVMYACGLKVSELINLCVNDLSLNEGYITVKGDSPRYIPIYKGAVKAVNTYIAKGRKYLVGEKKANNLFLNRNGSPLSRQGVWKILKTYGEKAGLSVTLTPHLIRRSMAVHLLENGANVYDVQAILGHKSIGLTRDYLKNFKPSVTKSYKTAHPKAKG